MHSIVLRLRTSREGFLILDVSDILSLYLHYFISQAKMDPQLIYLWTFQLPKLKAILLIDKNIYVELFSSLFQLSTFLNDFKRICGTFEERRLQITQIMIIALISTCIVSLVCSRYLLLIIIDVLACIDYHAIVHRNQIGNLIIAIVWLLRSAGVVVRYDHFS